MYTPPALLRPTDLRKRLVLPTCALLNVLPLIFVRLWAVHIHHSPYQSQSMPRSLDNKKFSIFLHNHDLWHHFPQRLLIYLVWFETKLFFCGVGDVETNCAPGDDPEAYRKAGTRRETAEGPGWKVSAVRVLVQVRLYGIER